MSDKSQDRSDFVGKIGAEFGGEGKRLGREEGMLAESFLTRIPSFYSMQFTGWSFNPFFQSRMLWNQSKLYSGSGENLPLEI